MKHLLRFWPVLLAVFTLIVAAFLSVRSWRVYDIFVLNRGGPGFPSITLFTADSCIRGKISSELHHFSFDDQSVPSDNGWHTLPNLLHDKDDPFYGQLHLLTPWNEPNHDGEFFAGLPVWLISLPGFLPLALVYRKRKQAQN